MRILGGERQLSRAPEGILIIAHELTVVLQVNLVMLLVILIALLITRIESTIFKFQFLILPGVAGENLLILIGSCSASPHFLLDSVELILIHAVLVLLQE